MNVHEITAEQRVARPRDDVFAFFARPENLARITPPWLGFRILTPSPVPMREGALIDYVIRLGPLPTRWRTMITTYDPPHRFVDEQLAGPYSYWHHTHEFLEDGDGTLLRDHVRYALPLGPLGDLVHALAVRRQVETIFAHRRRIIDDLFAGG
ncbi:MAG TPA: SRPBCC family protein [Candidatus Krumholzibacteria bacterium]|nr:SRPBCC family protein [Candidatus Krumholzibacteria bacterium]